MLRRAEEPAESERRICTHAALSQHDLVDSPRRYADVLRQTILAYPQGLHEFFKQDLAGVYWAEFPHISSSLMVINDLDIECVPVLLVEADPPLIVDSD